MEINCELLDLNNNIWKGYWDKNVKPKIYKISKEIDDDIRFCIKKEIKEHGSIVKRYGDWAKFINKEIGMANYPINPKYPFHRTLFYRGKRIKDYIIVFQGIT